RISQVHVKKGDKVKTGQKLFTIEPAGAAATAPPAPAPAAEVKATAKPTTATREPPKTAPPPPAPVRAAAAKVSGDGSGTGKTTQEKVVPAGPATRRLARELGVDLARVNGSAPGGRVTQEDVKAFVKELASGAVAPT